MFSREASHLVEKRSIIFRANAISRLQDAPEINRRIAAGRTDRKRAALQGFLLLLLGETLFALIGRRQVGRRQFAPRMRRAGVVLRTSTLAPRDTRDVRVAADPQRGLPAHSRTGWLISAFLPGSKKTRACGSARRASATYDQLPAQGSQRHRRARSFRPAAL